MDWKGYNRVEDDNGPEIDLSFPAPVTLNEDSVTDAAGTVKLRVYSGSDQPISLNKIEHEQYPQVIGFNCTGINNFHLKTLNTIDWNFTWSDSGDMIINPLIVVMPYSQWQPYLTWNFSFEPMEDCMMGFFGSINLVLTVSKLRLIWDLPGPPELNKV